MSEPEVQQAFADVMPEGPAEITVPFKVRDVAPTDMPEGSSIMVVNAPNPARDKAAFFWDILHAVNVTKQYAWDGKRELSPTETCKLIAAYQWLEAARVAFSLWHDRPLIRALGWPVTAPFPKEGTAGLQWDRGPEQWILVQFGLLSSERALSCTWERRARGGTLTGRSRDMRDLAAAIESTFKP